MALAEQLQDLTELLAAAHTRDEVLAAALRPAISALGALSGAVLLLDTEERLNLLAQQGHTDDRTVWQDGPVDPELPSGDALLRQQALYFERSGAMTAAYPHLEEKTGGVAAVGSALLPLLLDGRALGVLILDFKEPHAFTGHEHRFLSTLARQTSVALDRVDMIRQREVEAAAVRTSEARFRRMVEVSPVGMAVGSLDGRLTLVNDAYLRLLGYTRVEYEAGAIDWQTLTPPEYRAQDQQAFETAFAQGVSTTYEKVMLTKTGERLPLELTLIRYDAQQVVGYLKDLRGQKAQAATLQLEQNASQAFMAFTEAASHLEDVDQLGRLALETLQTVIPGSSAVFYDRTPTHWQPRLWTSDLHPELLMVLKQGLPLDTPVFAELMQTGAPVFVDGWTESGQGVAHTGQFQTAAVYPVTQQGHLCAVLSVALQEQPHWSEPQRATVRALGRSFSLLYDRIATTQEIQRQRAETMGRNRALEAFSTLTGVLDVRLGRYELIRRTQELVLSLLPPGYAGYYEPEEGLWRLKAQTGNAGSVALQQLIEVGVPVGGTPTLDTPMNTGEPYFIDVYAQDTDIDPEVASHLNAAACLPISIRNQFIGIFNIPLFHTMAWDDTDRAVLISAVQSLMLALEGAQSLAELAQQSAELEQSNQNLQEANEELEAFTYSASHDLRTPVRHVMGFAELAQKALEKTPNEKAEQYLNVVKQGAARMTELIDGMLLLSRSGRQALHMQPVNLNILVTQARRDVAAEFGSHPVRWQVGELPTVRGDHSLLQQVMTNLLSNAIKYSSKREVSEVEVWSEEIASEWMIRVRDNGVGFDPRYVQRLFGIFQRLHTEKEFKGTGVGLATVKRIVLKHGGRVEATGRPAEGATFSFVLPK